jgi:beta-phosphoglucomutase
MRKPTETIESEDILMKLIIFDFDGVIVDTEKERFRKLQKIAKNVRINIGNDIFSEIVGKKTRIFLQEQGLPPEQIDKLIVELYKNHTIPKLIPHAKKTIKNLSEKYQLAIVTGSRKSIVNKILNHYELKKYFNFIIYGEDFKSSKPDPECYLLAIKKTNIKIKDIVVIEDSQAGITSAKNAKLTVWALKTKYNQNQIKLANKIIRSHKELTELLIR